MTMARRATLYGTTAPIHGRSAQRTTVASHRHGDGQSVAPAPWPGPEIVWRQRPQQPVIPRRRVERDAPRTRLAHRGDRRHQHVRAAEILRDAPRPTQRAVVDRLQHHAHQPDCQQRQPQPIPIQKRRRLPPVDVHHEPGGEAEQDNGPHEHDLSQRRAALALHEERRRPAGRRRPSQQRHRRHDARVARRQPDEGRGARAG